MCGSYFLDFTFFSYHSFLVASERLHYKTVRWSWGHRPLWGFAFESCKHQILIDIPTYFLRKTGSRGRDWSWVGFPDDHNWIYASNFCRIYLSSNSDWSLKRRQTIPPDFLVKKVIIILIWHLKVELIPIMYSHFSTKHSIIEVTTHLPTYLLSLSRSDCHLLN